MCVCLDFVLQSRERITGAALVTGVQPGALLISGAARRAAPDRRGAGRRGLAAGRKRPGAEPPCDEPGGNVTADRIGELVEQRIGVLRHVMGIEGSEEGRGGKERGSTCKSRGLPNHKRIKDRTTKKKRVTE